MTARPPVLRQDVVDRLRSWSAGRQPDRPKGRVARALRDRVLPGVARPVRRMVVRVVDPSLQRSLEQLRREARQLESRGPGSAPPEVEVLRAELLGLQDRLVQLDRRLDSVERTVRPPA